MPELSRPAARRPQSRPHQLHVDNRRVREVLGSRSAFRELWSSGALGEKHPSLVNTVVLLLQRVEVELAVARVLCKAQTSEKEGLYVLGEASAHLDLEVANLRRGA